MNTESNQNSEINILVVDDARGNLMLLTKCLEAVGYEVRPAISGKAALEAASKYVPDMVLLDINMPDMDGYEVCKAFKGDAKLKEVPIIFISALDAPTDKVKAFKAGGVDYVTKPINFEEVRARVSTHVKIALLQRENRRTISELQNALSEVKALKGLLPICSHCKKIRDDKGYWNGVEEYFSAHADAEFSHSVCPECVESEFGGLSSGSGDDARSK